MPHAGHDIVQGPPQSDLYGYIIVPEIMKAERRQTKPGSQCDETLVTRHSARPPEGGIYSVAMLQMDIGRTHTSLTAVSP